MTPPAEPTRPAQLWFRLGVGVVGLLYLGYGLKRFSLGLDCTDEGAHLSWSLRMLFGERPFTSELVTLTRPVQAYLFLLFKLHPAMTVYEFRLLGWTMHLAAYAGLAAYLFQLSHAPLRSLLVASIPLFACNIFGLPGPYYNTLSSDFLVLALSLRGLSGLRGGSRKAEFAAGIAFFVVTLAHPGLGLVVALLLVFEIVRRDLLANLVRGRPTPSNIGVLVLLGCWLLFLGYLVVDGALADWWQRFLLHRSLTPASADGSTPSFFRHLVTLPFNHSDLALKGTLVTVGTAVALQVFLRRNQPVPAAYCASLLAILLLAGLVVTYRQAPLDLPFQLAFVSLVLLGTLGAGAKVLLPPSDRPAGELLLLAGLSTLLYATFTYFFTYLRSWTSGLLGLPVVFAVGLTLLLRAGNKSAWPLRVLANVALLLAVACVARQHYRSIYRDAEPAALRATSRIPALRGIYSTPERMAALDNLYDYLQPRVARGSPLLAYDRCPLLYYLFGARPVYGMTWAAQYSQSPAMLQQLDRELNAQSLPAYAIRNLVDVSYAVWASAPRIPYENYPLHATVLAHYELERTFFPFEVWKLKSPGKGETTFPSAPTPGVTTPPSAP